MEQEIAMARGEVRVTSTGSAKKSAGSTAVKRTARGRPASSQKGPDPRGAALDILDFAKVYHSSSGDRIQTIKAGVSAKKLYDLATALRVSQDVMIKRLGLPKSTISRKAQANDTLTADQSERVLGLSKLVGLVQTIIAESGDPDEIQDFDAATWLEQWLSQPNPALGGELPSAYLDTREGQEFLSTLIAQMQSGAYA
jgi:putative toxin-antitoxin system antitoxin component (TIGR02293 family)